MENPTLGGGGVPCFTPKEIEFYLLCGSDWALHKIKAVLFFQAGFFITPGCFTTKAVVY
jgi:hypothetical protein